MDLKVKVVSTSISKKGRKYVQVEILEGDMPKTDTEATLKIESGEVLDEK